ncbi:hypothetical protein ACJX0J_034349, partial [Zea mays]
ALVDMYDHLGAPGDARKAFEEIRAPGGIWYTSLISAFMPNDWTDGVWPDGCTFGSMMSALGNMKRVRQGREAHTQVVTRGLCGNVICGMMVDARKVFDRMKAPNAVSWCALLGGYCQTGKHEK